MGVAQEVGGVHEVHCNFGHTPFLCHFNPQFGPKEQLRPIVVSLKKGLALSPSFSLKNHLAIFVLE